MFFDDAPSTFDNEELIKANKSDFEKLMDLAFEDQSFPFGNQVSKDGTFYAYKGIVNALHFYKCLKASELFKGLFYKLDDVINYLKSKCIPWNKNKDTTKQIISSEGKIRVYLIHNWKVKGKPLIEMSETEPRETPDLPEGCHSGHSHNHITFEGCKTWGTLRLNLLSSYGKTPEGPERVERVKDTNGLTNQVTQL
jgi:hypothetical protein